MIYFILNVDTLYMHCKQYVEHKPKFTIGRQSGDHRPNDGQYPASVCDGSLIKCHRPTVLRSSADWRPMIERPSTDIMMKKSSKSRPIVGWSTGDHCPTLHRWQNPWKSADRSTKLLTWVLRQKVVGRPKNYQNRCRRRPTIDRRRPIFLFCAHRPSVDRRFG